MSASSQINVLVYGLGAIGSFYAFFLSKPDCVRLTVVARSNHDAVKSNGLRITSSAHGEHIIHPHAVTRDPAEITTGQAFDYVVCAHKAVDQEAAIRQLAPVITQQTTIVIIQNGVGNEEPFRQAFPACTIISAVTWCFVRQVEPGVIKHSDWEDMQLGLYPNALVDEKIEAQRLDTFANLLEAGHAVFQVVPDIQLKRWEKVVSNALWNPITTLTQLDSHSWMSSSADAIPLSRRLMTEVVDVARANGVLVDYQIVDNTVNRFQGMAPVGSSMLEDFKKARPMEVECILGHPVKRARELGIATPTLEILYAILTAVNGRFASMSSQSTST